MLARVARSFMFKVVIGLALLAFLVWEFAGTDITWESLANPWALFGLAAGASLPFLLAWALMKIMPSSNDDDQSEAGPSERS